MINTLFKVENTWKIYISLSKTALSNILLIIRYLIA